jgi:chromosomal replication initiation ATPase DnaA
MSLAQVPAPGKSTQILYLIESIISRIFMVRSEDLHAPSRMTANVAFARQVAMYLAHVECNVELAAVSRMFGRDRTTVRHACSVVEDSRDDPAFELTLELLIGILGRMRDISALQAQAQRVPP